MAPQNRMANWKRVEDQPAPEWEQVTAWMKRKNPNWKRVEPKMRALAVRKARFARQSLMRARQAEEDERMKGLCREAVEWLPIVNKDQTAIERMPDTFQSLPFSPSNKDIFRKMRFNPPSSNKRISPSLPSIKQIYLQRPRRPSPPPRLPRSPPRLFKPPPSFEEVKKLFEPPARAPEEEKEGLKMILIATLEEMRDRLPPESNQRRWFEAMLKNKPSS